MADGARGQKNRKNKDNFDGIKIEQPKVGPQGERHGCLKSYGPESAKLGLFLLLQDRHFRHPWRSGGFAGQGRSDAR